MLGSNCKVSQNLHTKSCIEIKDWNTSPQSRGCIKYNNKYYINLVTGNTQKPDEGLLSGTYAVGSDDYCDIIKYHSDNKNTCEESATFMKFFNGIKEYSNCTEEDVFHCNDFIIFKNKNGEYELHQSLINNNDRHPHDREVWKNLGVFSNILKLIFDEADGKQLTIPYWEKCKGKSCSSVYMKNQCVAERIETGKFDNCGNPIYDEFIFNSLVDDNIDQPSIGAEKETPTWDGPYTDCEWFNRQVGYTVNGDTISQGNNHILLSKNDLCDSSFEWNDVESGQCENDCDPKLVKQVCTKPIGTDENGIVINNGTESELISLNAPHNGLHWVDVPTDSCAEDCEHPTERKLQVKPCDDSIVVDSCGVKVGSLKNIKIGVDLNGDDIFADEDCLLTCDDVLAEKPIVIEDTIVDGKKVKLWKLLYNKGLEVFDEKLQVLLDTTKGLYFEGNKIAIAIAKGLEFTGGKLQALLDTNKGLYFEGNKIAIAVGKALGFAANGKVDVLVDNETLTVNADNQLETVCTELAYGFGTDSGNETVAGHYQYDVSKKNYYITGGMEKHIGDGSEGDAGAVGFKVPRDGIYEIEMRVAVTKTNAPDNADCFIGVYLNGHTVGYVDPTGAGISGGVFGQRFGFGSGLGIQSNGESARENRFRIMELKAGDTITMASVPANGWSGFAGHIKGASDLKVKELPRSVARCPNS